MKYWRQPRLGAICAFLYVLLFVAGTAYRSSQAALPDTTGQPSLTQNQILLQFAHAHLGLFTLSAFVTILAFLVLIGTVFGLYAYVAQRGKQRIGTITLAVGLGGLAVSCISTAVGTVALANSTNQYAAHHLIATVKDFQSQGTLFSVLDIVGSEAIAVWLGLAAATIIRIQGNRSIAGWSTLAAAALAGIGFPVALVLVVWSLGAGAGLWRLSEGVEGRFAPADGTAAGTSRLRSLAGWGGRKAAMVEDAPADEPAAEDETLAQPTRTRTVPTVGASRTGTPGRRGAAARRRRR
ncbi:MAG TPA: hypothetical protein VNL35_19565 [Chloroflexota bacterium]|nr:hypothetical protein [Chloroflexota bacterium]